MTLCEVQIVFYDKFKIRLYIIKLIAPSARAQAALLMRWAKGEHTTAEIARTLNTSWPAISRLEDPHHWPNLRQLERAAAAIGQRLVISLEPVSGEIK